jgi:diguanylate cyclase (GGDEF)-like protein
MHRYFCENAGIRISRRMPLCCGAARRIKLYAIPKSHRKRLALTFLAYMAVIVAGTLLANTWSALYGQLVLGAACLVLLVQLLGSQRLELALHERMDSYRKKAHLFKDKAYSDSLTGLANRLLLADRFELTATRSKRQATPFALLMIDLNAFKAVNDNYGHAAGDQVLVTVAKRLLATVRASDTVARVGGDEFVLLIESFKNTDELVHLGRKLVTNISKPITLEKGLEVQVGASVGFALWPKNGAAMDDLMNVADQGMYDCKISGLMGLS